MKASRTAFFLLITSLVLLSCSPLQRMESCSESQQEQVPYLRVLDPSLGRLLFKSSIQVGKKDFSGLFLIKETDHGAATRVVFLSEVGLNLLDLEFRGGEYTVMSVKDFLNRKSIIRTLGEDFQTLLLDLSELPSACGGPGEPEGSWSLEFRYMKQAYRYTYCEGYGTCHILRKKGLLRRVHYELDGGNPGKISIRHSGSGLKIELSEVKMVK